MKGVVGFEKDLVRQGTVLLKTLFFGHAGRAGAPVRAPVKVIHCGNGN